MSKTKIELQSATLRRWLVGTVAAALVLGVHAVQAQQYKGEIFHPMLVTRTGPFALAATAVSSGQQDYFTLVNLKGGVEGHKIVWEECEFAYATPRALECYERYRGKWKILYPNSTPVINALMDRLAKDNVLGINPAGGRPDSMDGQTFPYLAPVVNTFWAQTASTIRYISQLEGGDSKLKGKKIAYIHLDNEYGKFPFPILDALAKKLGFEWRSWPLPMPALEQSAAWLDIARRYRADYVIGWLYGQSCHIPYTEMRRVGYSKDKYIGTLWCGSEEDVLPGGELTVGAVSANYHGTGNKFPVIQEILKNVHQVGKGNIDSSRVGTVAYNRGVLTGIIIVEAFRNAIKTYGTPLQAKNVRDGFRMIRLDNARLEQLGAKGLMPELIFSERNHGGMDPQIFQKWDGQHWNAVSEWVLPYEDVVRAEVEKSIAAYKAQIRR